MTAGAPALDHVETWIFDLDNTLYPAESRLWEQVDKRIGEILARTLSLPLDRARVVQKDYLARYGTTLRGLMVEHGTDPAEYLAQVHDIDLSPIAPNPALDATLARLPGRKLVFTNATEEYAARVLARLGIADRFEAVFDIHAARFLPKPEPAVYRALVRQHAIAPRRALLVEDIARNLKPAHDMGMTTAWVRVDWPWSQPGSDTAHIHHVIDNLTHWLAGVAAALVPAERTGRAD